VVPDARSLTQWRIIALMGTDSGSSKAFFLEYLRTFRFSGGTEGTGGTASNGKASSGSLMFFGEGTGGTGASVKMGWYFATP
jgi:hypothetical protein